MGFTRSNQTAAAERVSGGARSSVRAWSRGSYSSHTAAVAVRQATSSGSSVTAAVSAGTVVGGGTVVSGGTSVVLVVVGAVLGAGTVVVAWYSETGTPSIKPSMPAELSSPPPHATARRTNGTSRRPDASFMSLPSADRPRDVGRVPGSGHVVLHGGQRRGGDRGNWRGPPATEANRERTQAVGPGFVRNGIRMAQLVSRR